MSEDKRLHDLMATGILNYNQSLEIATASNNHSIANFCKHQIVNYCSGVYRIGHFNGVMQSLEEMKQNNGADMANIDKSIKDLQTEQVATTFVNMGYTQIPDMASGKIILTLPETQQDQEWSYSCLKEGATGIPSEFVKPVAENLQTKLEMPETFANQAPLISNALSALTESRAAEFTTEAVK